MSFNKPGDTCFKDRRVKRPGYLEDQRQVMVHRTFLIQDFSFEFVNEPQSFLVIRTGFFHTNDMCFI